MKINKLRKVPCHWHLDDLEGLMDFCAKWMLACSHREKKNLNKDTQVRKYVVILENIVLCYSREYMELIGVEGGWIV